MAENLGTAVLTLKTDQSGLDKGLSKARSQAQSFGKSMTSWGKTMSMRMSAPLAAAGAAAVKFASDLGESMNAVGVVFEDASGTIERFGETASTTVGLAQADFNELATVIGAQLKQSGMSMDEVSDQTINLTQRAADLASVFNTSVKDATNALGSALRGEAEPARRFGVNVSQAAIQAQALADGMIEAGDEMSEAQKVQARLNLIMEQSADVAGDFQNTSDALANQLRILWAELKNVGAEFGEVLIPVVKDIVGFVGNAVQVFSGLSDTSKTVIVVMAALAAAIPPVTIAIGAMLTVVGTGVTIISGGLIPALGLLTAAAIALIENWEAVTDALSNAWKTLISDIKSVINWVDRLIGKLGNVETRSSIVGIRDGMKETAGATRSWADEAERGSRATRNAAGTVKEEQAARRGMYSIQKQQRAETEIIEDTEKEITSSLERQRSLRQEMVDSIRSGLEQAAARTGVLETQWEKIRDVTDAAIGAPRQKTAEEIVRLTESMSVELAIQENSAEGLKGWQEDLLELYEEAKDVLSDQADEMERAALASKKWGDNFRSVAQLDLPGTTLLQGGGEPAGPRKSRTPDATGRWDRLVEVIKEGLSTGLSALGGGALSMLGDLGKSLLNLILSANLIQEVFKTLTNDILRGLKPVINALAQALVELSPFFQILGQILGDILMPVVRVISQILTSLRPVFAAIARLLTAIKGIIQALLPSISAVVKVLVDALQPAIDIVAVVLSALAPYFAAITGLLKMLAPVIQLLMIPIQALASALIWLHDNVIKPIGNALLSAMETVANSFIDIARGVIEAINKIPGVNISKPKRVDFGRIESIGDVASEIEGPDTDAAEGGTGGGAASIEQARPITVNMTISDNQIAGDGSFRDLAITIRRELEALGAINA